MTMHRRTTGHPAIRAMWLACALAAHGCGGQPPTESPAGGDLGAASLALSVTPEGTACLRVTASGGRLVVRPLDVVAGQSAVFTLTGLPVGFVTFTADTFNQRCSDIDASTVAEWVSEPVRVTLQPGIVAAVTLTLRRNVKADVGLDFSEDVAQLSAANSHSYVVLWNGALVCWGETCKAPPAGALFRQVSFGYLHACGITLGGPVVCWGNDDYGQATPPAGRFAQISAGAVNTCGIDLDGAVVCWGSPTTAQAMAPAGKFSQISLALTYACGVRDDGQIVCWGDDHLSLAAVPPGGTFTRVSAGMVQACGVRSDGTAACWGRNDVGQSSPPTGTFTQVSASHYHACGVRTDGTLACWGANAEGESSPPSGTFLQVAVGASHSCGLRADNKVLCWGYNASGQTAVPPAL